MNKSTSRFRYEGGISPLLPLGRLLRAELPAEIQVTLGGRPMRESSYNSPSEMLEEVVAPSCLLPTDRFVFSLSFRLIKYFECSGGRPSAAAGFPRLPRYAAPTSGARPGTSADFTRTFISQMVIQKLPFNVPVQS